MIDNNKKKADGEIDLILKNANGRTITERCRFNGVMKVSPTMHLDRECISTYFLIQLGGGFVEGEYYLSNIKLLKNTRAIVTTQASTKVYKCPKDKETLQETNLRMEEGSILEFINDPVILYKDARYRQVNNIYLEDGASLIYTDGITSGWSPDGSKFSYTSGRMKTNIYYDEKLISLDNLVLEPSKYDITKLGFLEGFLNFGTLVFINRNVDMKLVENLREALKDYEKDISFGISLLEENGLIMRVIGNMTQEIEGAMLIVQNYIRKEFFKSETLFVRKY